MVRAKIWPIELKICQIMPQLENVFHSQVFSRFIVYCIFINFFPEKLPKKDLSKFLNQKHSTINFSWGIMVLKQYAQRFQIMPSFDLGI